MELLPIIYLGYMFISIYFLSLFIFLYVHNRKNLFDYPETKKTYSISVLVPAWNEEKTIKDTIEHIFRVDYPIKELIVLNDGSTDSTEEIVKMLMKKYPKLKIIKKKNSGKGDSLNKGIAIAKGELVVVVDADSYPDKDSFKKLVGFFDEEKVGAATCVFVPRNANKFIEKMQIIEYNVIAFTRKLLGYVDAIYVTPGPLAMYRKTALEKVGGFDSKNMTEDIEITWRLTYAGYERRMCLSTNATTTVPDTLKAWYRQRRRWNVGGLQCISKYKKNFLKKGMLGLFILPFFVLQLFLGALGLGIFFYLIITRFISNYLLVKYSIPVGVPILTINNLFITPSFLNYLGVILFVAGLIFTLLVLSIMKETVLKKQNIFNILFYSFVYLMIYPFIMISAVYNYFKEIRSGDNVIKNQKYIFLYALILTLVIFNLGIFFGYMLETSRVNTINTLYTDSEMELLDQMTQKDALNILNLDCNSLVSENIQFGDRIFSEALEIQKYEDANRITNEIVAQHKKFDLLRAIFWINSIEIKQKCNSSYHNVIYFYKYNNPSIEQDSKQKFFSNLLVELKQKEGDNIMLIPMAADNNITSIDLFTKKYNITELPTILIDEKTKVTDVNSIDDIEKYLV